MLQRLSDSLDPDWEDSGFDALNERDLAHLAPEILYVRESRAQKMVQDFPLTLVLAHAALFKWAMS